MILGNDFDYVKVTVLFERPTNSFQEELLADVLKELSELQKTYDTNYQEYL